MAKHKLILVARCEMEVSAGSYKAATAKGVEWLLEQLPTDDDDEPLRNLSVDSVVEVLPFASIAGEP